MKKGGLKTKTLIFLRKINLLSRKEQPIRPMKIKTVVGYDQNFSDLESQRHVFILNRLSVRRGCKFNVDTKTCSCGANVDDFLTKKYC
jgi:hypothetical protein